MNPTQKQFPISQFLECVVRDVEAIRQVAEKPLGRRLVLDCAELTSEERNAWQERINTLAVECGCSWSAVFLGGAVLTYLVLLATTGYRQAMGLWTHLGVGIGTAVLSAGAGKALGLMRARRRLKETLWKLVWLVEERRTGRKDDCHANVH